MKSWGDLIVPAVFWVLTLYFAWTGEIHWRGGGYTRRSDNPVLYYLVLIAFGGVSIYLLVTGLEKHGVLP